MDLFTPKPSSLIKWALARPDASPLPARVATDPGVLVLARGLGVLGLYASRWNITWVTEPPYDALPDLTDARIGEMHARTRATLLARVDVLERDPESDDSHTGRLLRDRANFRRLLAHPNSAPAGVRAALSAAVAEDMMATEVGDRTQLPLGEVAAIKWGPIGAWLTNQILVAMMDPNWGEDEPLPDPDELEYDCDQCREDAYTPWELVWKYYSKADLAVHISTYHAPLAQAKRYLESLKSTTAAPGSRGPGGVGYACPGWDYGDPNNVRRCDKKFATHEALADHMLRAHLDDVGAELPARYLVVFAEIAASKAPIPQEGEQTTGPTPQSTPQSPKPAKRNSASSVMTTITSTNTIKSTNTATTATTSMNTSMNANAATSPKTKSKRRTADEKHAAEMAHWLPQMRKWAEAEIRHNESQQSRRFVEFMERHPPTEDFWNSLDESREYGETREKLTAVMLR